MALGRTLRRVVLVLVGVAAGGFAVMHPEAVKAFYQDIYPSDPAKRQALDLCFMQDHKFNRLDAAERETCYRRALVPIGEVAASPAADRPDVNLVDLQRAAAQGSMPNNDIRRLEQTQNATHSPH